jgi:hypothetical protein
MTEITLGDGKQLTIKASQIITTHETLQVVVDQSKTIELIVKIEADFGQIPEDYHEVMLNVMTSRYHAKVSFGDNPFSQCISTKKKKWWQIWK